MEARNATDDRTIGDQKMANMIMDTFLSTIPHPLKQKLLLCA
ncbi:MAG: hypothetical protein ACOX2A_05410 [Tepidanaerobacteraceae bacterium]